LGPIQDGEIVRIVIEPIGGFQVNVTDPLKRRWVKGIDHAAAAWVKRYVARLLDWALRNGTASGRVRQRASMETIDYLDHGADLAPQAHASSWRADVELRGCA